MVKASLPLILKVLKLSRGNFKALKVLKMTNDMSLKVLEKFLKALKKSLNLLGML